jgi:hypothetical protein
VPVGSIRNFWLLLVDTLSCAEVLYSPLVDSYTFLCGKDSQPFSIHMSDTTFLSWWLYLSSLRSDRISTVSSHKVLPFTETFLCTFFFFSRWIVLFIFKTSFISHFIYVHFSLTWHATLQHVFISLPWYPCLITWHIVLVFTWCHSYLLSVKHRKLLL